MRIESQRIAVDTPRGWEAEIYRRHDGGFVLHDADNTRAVVHLANFPLPPERGDFGSGAVEIMSAGDILMVLFEYGPESAGSALFATQGWPPVREEDFAPDKMQRPLPGQSGAQYFFRIGERPFCLYVALGSYLLRSDAVEQVNAILASIAIG